MGKLREKDALTMDLLKKGVSDKVLYDEIKINLEYQITHIQNVERPDIILQQAQLISYKEQIKELSLETIDTWINKNCKWISNDVEGLTYAEVKTFLYLYYSFDNYTRQIRHTFCDDLDELKVAFRNIFGKQSQFAKYGIIPIDNSRELLPIDPPRVYDKVLNRTFFTKNIPLILLEKIDKMKSSGIINDFSVRLVNEPGYEGRLRKKYLAEALERGKIFDLVSLGNCSISKLYSEDYEDCMWVIIDQQNITFEELCKNFETLDDMVVTQVVHLQYEYTIREDIVICMEELDLSPKQAKALLRSPCPLDDVYKEFKDRESENMDTIRDSIETRANDVIKRDKNRESR